MREVARRGFEVGVHTYDHIKWQDGVARASLRGRGASSCWRVRELIRVFDRAPQAHGAAGWQVNDSVPGLEEELGFHYASDVRGVGPFVPVVGGNEVPVPQLPTTLPTLDELIGREDLGGVDPIEHLRGLTREGRDQVFTLHAEDSRAGLISRVSSGCSPRGRVWASVSRTWGHTRRRWISRGSRGARCSECMSRRPAASIPSKTPSRRPAPFWIAIRSPNPTA